MALADLNEKLRPFRELLDAIDAAAKESVSTGQLLVERKNQLAAVNVELDQAIARRKDLLVKLAAEEATTAKALDGLKADVQAAHRGADQAIKDLQVRRQSIEHEVDGAILAAREAYNDLQQRLAEETAAAQERLNVINAALNDAKSRAAAVANG